MVKWRTQLRSSAWLAVSGFVGCRDYAGPLQTDEPWSVGSGGMRAESNSSHADPIGGFQHRDNLTEFGRVSSRSGAAGTAPSGSSNSTSAGGQSVGTGARSQAPPVIQPLAGGRGGAPESSTPCGGSSANCTGGVAPRATDQSALGGSIESTVSLAGASGRTSTAAISSAGASYGTGCATSGEPCARASECLESEVECGAAGATCRYLPRPMRHSCHNRLGMCTGDGSCVLNSLSCAVEETPGCGMVTIEGGTFTMGLDNADVELYAAPAQEYVTVGSFVMDAYEVTVGRFRRFFEAGFQVWPDPIQYPNGNYLRARKDDFILPEETGQGSNVYNWSAEPADRESYPINRVHWSVAMSFCAWDGGRLPTEAEWEYAARGRRVEPGLASGRLYPWGDELPTCRVAHTQLCLEGATTTSVLSGRLAAGGIYDLAGNVAEWTADSFQEYGFGCWPGAGLPPNPLCFLGVSQPRTVRGGTYSSTFDGLLKSFARKGSELRSAPVGFRCVRDIQK